jgi:catechol 2,3-dioxygenase-like lactoylglutathione lyase family enzyme
MAEASLAGLTMHVADLDRSLEFYRGIPGAHVAMHQPGKCALVRFGSGHVALIQGSGGVEVGLETDDVEQLRSVVGGDGDPGSVTLRDPDGNVLRFTAEEFEGNFAGQHGGVPMNPHLRDEDRGLG